MGPNDVQQTLTELVEQLKDEELFLRLRNFEDNFVERKSSSDSQDWLRTAVAFANSTPVSYPSVLFIGVTDEGEPEEREDVNLENLQKSFARKLGSAYPPIYYHVKVLAEKGKQVLAVIIPGSRDRPHFAGPSYVRVGAETKEASAEQFDTLVAQRQSKAYEISKWIGKTITTEHWLSTGRKLGDRRTLVGCNAFYVTLAPMVNPTIQESVPLQRVDVSFDDQSRTLKLEIRSD